VTPDQAFCDTEPFSNDVLFRLAFRLIAWCSALIYASSAFCVRIRHSLLPTGWCQSLERQRSACCGHAPDSVSDIVCHQQITGFAYRHADGTTVCVAVVV
jgi:hypothetical protein